MNRNYSVGILMTAFSLLLVFPSCEEEDMKPLPESAKVRLVLSILEVDMPGGRVNSSVGLGSRLYLTMHTKDGKPTEINQRGLEFKRENQKIVIEDILLPPGEYQITRVFVKDSVENIIFAGPQASSKLADHSTHALPLSFNVVQEKEKNLSLEVFSTLGHTPEDFGYKEPEVIFNTGTWCPDVIYLGNVNLSTQKQIDDFGSKCIYKIVGGLYMNFNEPVDLSPLQSLRVIEGSLHLEEYRYPMHNNLILSSLEGLHNLESVDYLWLRNLKSIESFEKLEKLKVVNDLIILAMPKVTNLQGLENLKVKRRINIQGCDALINLKGLESVFDLEYISVKDNPNLESLHGLPNLGRLGRLSLQKNRKIGTLSGLFETPPSSISSLFIFSSYLTNLKGLFSEKLKITESLYLASNYELTTLEGLHVAEEINGGVVLIGNIELSDISTLQNIRSVGKSLTIAQNFKLASLEGLQNLVKIDLEPLESIQIYENQILEDYCSLLPLLKIYPDVPLEVKSNAYNPTAQEILEGKCSI